MNEKLNTDPQAETSAERNPVDEYMENLRGRIDAIAMLDPEPTRRGRKTKRIKATLELYSEGMLLEIHGIRGILTELLRKKDLEFQLGPWAKKYGEDLLSDSESELLDGLLEAFRREHKTVANDGRKENYSEEDQRMAAKIDMLLLKSLRIRDLRDFRNHYGLLTGKRNVRAWKEKFGDVSS